MHSEVKTHKTRRRLKAYSTHAEGLRKLCDRTINIWFSFNCISVFFHIYIYKSIYAVKCSRDMRAWFHGFRCPSIIRIWSCKQPQSVSCVTAQCHWVSMCGKYMDAALNIYNLRYSPHSLIQCRNCELIIQIWQTYIVLCTDKEFYLICKSSWVCVSSLIMQTPLILCACLVNTMVW